MLSLTLFVSVLRSPAASSISNDVGGILRPSATPAATPSAVAASPTPAATPQPTPAPTVVPTATPAPTVRACTTACQIRGRVTTSAGQPIANARVNVYRSPENSIVGSGITDVNGNYTFTVAAGNYKFYFNPPFTNYIAEWYADKISINTANVVSVRGNVTINATLASR